MDWFRVYHSISTDPKLHKASRRAKVSRGLMLGAWIATLDYASQQKKRGTVEGLDAETLAYLIDGKPSTATAILAAMREVGLIQDESIAAWSKRQRNSDDVAVRVREHRARKESGGESTQNGLAKPNGSENGHIKPLENLETGASGNVTETSRTEQNRTDTGSNDPDSPLTPHSGGGNELNLGGPAEKSGLKEGKPKRRGREAASYLPKDWQPTAEDWRYAHEKGYSDDEIRNIAEEFKNHWLQASGPDALKRDWSAAWRKRIGNLIDYGRGPGSRGGPGGRSFGSRSPPQQRRASPTASFRANLEILEGPDDDDSQFEAVPCSSGRLALVL